MNTLSLSSRLFIVGAVEYEPPVAPRIHEMRCKLDAAPSGQHPPDITSHNKRVGSIAGKLNLWINETQEYEYRSFTLFLVVDHNSDCDQ